MPIDFGGDRIIVDADMTLTFSYAHSTALSSRWMFLILGILVPGIITRMPMDFHDDFIIVDGFIVFLIFVLLTALCQKQVFFYLIGGIFHLFSFIFKLI